MSDPNPNGAETDLATGPRVVLDYPARDLARRARRRLVTLAGGALVLIGVTASIGAVPACIGALALLAGWVLSDPIDDLPPTETVLACVILTPVAIGGLYYGLRLLRRHRTFVLFLRRFGHDDAQQAVSFAVLIFPLQPVVSFVSSLTKAVGEGEAAKTAVAQSEFDVRETARAIAGRSRRVFAPRLVVVTVTASEWQLAVRELAARAFVVLLDVSEPTSNVLWELEELTSTGTPYVAIGELGQVARVASPAAEDFPDDGLACRLRALLGEREILAYTTDPRGLGRFARALRAVLLERERFCEATAAPARGSARSAPSRSAGP